MTVVCLSIADASLDRVSTLIATAASLDVDEQRLAQAQQACVNRNASAAAALQAAVQAEPFSVDILRLRLLDAKRLGLSSEAQSAQGKAMYTTHTADPAVALALYPLHCFCCPSTAPSSLRPVAADAAYTTQCQTPVHLPAQHSPCQPTQAC